MQPDDGPGGQADSKHALRHHALRVAIIIAACELGVSLLLYLAGLDPLQAIGALLNITLLVATTTPLLIFTVFQPFAQRHQAALETAKHQALHDQLTGLPNRRLLFEHLEKCLHRLSRDGKAAALLYLDLDGFKSTNDRFGHAAGDAVLNAVARRVLRTVRADDVFARLGGDEFMLLLQNAGPDIDIARANAARIAIKIQRVLAEPVLFGEHRIPIATSIGINLVQSDNTNSARKAIQEADIAMYAAKRSSPGSIVFSTQAELQTYPFVATGNRTIDQEHREIDDLLQGLADGGDSPGRLAEAVALHFASEAGVARHLGRPLSPGHLNEHQRLEAMIRALPHPGDTDESLIVAEELRVALRRHIIEFDLEIIRPESMATGQRPAIA